MVYCFIHAPNKYGWNGELLLQLEKPEGKFREKEVRKKFELLYPADDFYEMHYDPDPTQDQVAAYLLRRENDLMQRISIVKSYEDMTWEEWTRGIEKHYPHLALYARFTRTLKVLIVNEPPTL